MIVAIFVGIGDQVVDDLRQPLRIGLDRQMSSISSITTGLPPSAASSRMALMQLLSVAPDRHFLGH